MRRDQQPPTGEKIAVEIEREMEERLYPLRNVTLAPAEYHIYLHPDDFAYVEGIVPRIVEDVQTCLNSLVQRLNHRSVWSRLTASNRHPAIEVPAGGWAIHIKASANDEVNPGEIGIHSRLSVPMGARYGTGAGTIRITDTLVAGTDRRSRTRTEPIVPEANRPAEASPYVGSRPAEAGPSVGPQPAAITVPPIPSGPSGDDGRPAEGGLYLGPAHVGLHVPRPITISGPRLLYRDDSGEHVHPINKEFTKIGRGGAEHWVDVMVSAGAQVSREHCRIRRDAGGRLYLQDVSTWGTYLNGVAVEKFVDGDASPREHELTHGASIRLADAVTLELLLR